jgi:hypothetical protein
LLDGLSKEFSVVSDAFLQNKIGAKRQKKGSNEDGVAISGFAIDGRLCGVDQLCSSGEMGYSWSSSNLGLSDSKRCEETDGSRLEEAWGSEEGISFFAMRTLWAD